MREDKGLKALDPISHENADLHYIGGALAPPSQINPISCYGLDSLGESPFVAREDHVHGFSFSRDMWTTVDPKTAYSSTPDYTLTNAWAEVTGCAATKTLVISDKVNLEFSALVEQTAVGAAQAEFRFTVNGAGYSTVFLWSGNANTTGLVHTISASNVYTVPSSGSYTFKLEARWTVAAGWVALTGSLLFVSILAQMC